jgi:predicted metalloprotease with PDZ domain
MGAITRVAEGRLLVSQVVRDSPADQAGLTADDELISIDATRLGPDGLDTPLAQHRPGDKVTLLVSRRNELRRVEVTLAVDPSRVWILETRPDASAEQKARLETWLGM